MAHSSINVVVAGTFSIAKEHLESFHMAVETMVAETRKEEGCVSYEFYADRNDQSLFIVFEEWSTDEALEAHGASPHMADFKSYLETHPPLAVSVKKYAVDSITDLM